MREGHTQVGDATGSKAEPVETIGQVSLGEPNKAKLGMGMPEEVEDALQGTTKLHGFRGSEGNCVGIDIVEGVIHNDTWAAVALRDHSQGRQFEVREVLDQSIGEHNPVALTDKVQHFLTEEIQVIFT